LIACARRSTASADSLELRRLWPAAQFISIHFEFEFFFDAPIVALSKSRKELHMQQLDEAKSRAAARRLRCVLQIAEAPSRVGGGDQ
jgi:hypothetical protein